MWRAGARRELVRVCLENKQPPSRTASSRLEGAAFERGRSALLEATPHARLSLACRGWALPLHRSPSLLVILRHTIDSPSLGSGIVALRVARGALVCEGGSGLLLLRVCVVCRYVLSFSLGAGFGTASRPWPHGHDPTGERDRVRRSSVRVSTIIDHHSPHHHLNHACLGGWLFDLQPIRRVTNGHSGRGGRYLPVRLITHL